MWHKLIGFAVAGALGTLARYALAGIVQQNTNPGFPWGTWAVNAIGCFAFSAIWSVTQERLMMSGETRTIILVGFLGAFTTFSAFIFETSEFIEHGQWLMAGLNVIGQSAVGLAAFILGAFFARAIL